MPEPFRTTDDGLLVDVHVQPRAGRRGITGRHGDAVKLRVTAPPTEGRANDEAARVLADALDVAPARVTLVSGGRSRFKRFAVEGVPEALAARLRSVVREAEARR